MELHRNVYQKFYDDVLANFRDNVLIESEWNKTDAKGINIPLKKDSRKWWELTRWENGKTVYLSHKITGGVSEDPFILYRILKEYNKPVSIGGIETVREYQNIKDKIILAGLRFLQIEFPENLKLKVDSHEREAIEAKVLMQVFLQDRQPDLLLAFPNLLLFDSDSFELIKPESPFHDIEQNLNNAFDTTSSEKRFSDRKTPISLEFEETDTIIDEIQSTILDHFGLIGIGNYIAAFEQCSPEIKYDHFGGNLDKYSKQFQYVKELTDIEVLNTKECKTKDGLYSSKVLYTEIVDVPSCVEIENILKARVGNRSCLNAGLGPIFSRANINEITDLVNQIPLFSLLNYKYFELIVASGIDEKYISELFPNKKRKSRKRLLTVDISYRNNNWLIEKIEPIYINKFEQDEYDLDWYIPEKWEEKAPTAGLRYIF